MRVVNQSTGQLLAGRASVADTFWSRFIGLMGKKGLAPGEALILRPCNGVHTLFMRFAIDVIHVGDKGRVVRVLGSLKPWRAGPVVRDSLYVIELPAGGAGGVSVGDRIEIIPSTVVSSE